MGWVVNATPRPIYPRERPGTHCIGGWVGPGPVWTGAENLTPTWIRHPDRPVRSESLYRLSYRGPHIYECTVKYVAFWKRRSPRYSTCTASLIGHLQAVFQRYQSKLLRTITNAPWYVTNHTLHSDLHIPYVREVFLERIANHRTTIAKHPNPLMAPLLRSLTTRRLKRRWTFDGLH